MTLSPPRWTVVTPTNRPERLDAFLSAWWDLFREHKVHWITIFDGDENVRRYGDEWHAWDSIPEWIPRRSDMIRSWGIYQAWLRGSDYTLSLDDDVLPDGDLFAEYEAVFERGAPVSSYFDVGSLTDSGLQMRGFPHGDRQRREVAIQYGGWSGVLDYDAQTQLDKAREKTDSTFARIAVPVPKGAAVTGCVMNQAWRTKYAPLVWQLPLLVGRYQRWGDIWSGLLSKRVCDLFGMAVVVNGKAQVRHDRASDPEANLVREAAGMSANEDLGDALSDERIYVQDPIEAYRIVSDVFAEEFSHDREYVGHFRRCRDEWLKLYE